MKCALARGARHFGDPLESTARRVKTGATTKLNPSTFRKLPAKAKSLSLIHDAVQIRVFVFVFEGKIEMAARRTLQTPHLAFYPKAQCCLFYGTFKALRQLEYRKDTRRIRVYPAHRFSSRTNS